MWCMRSSVPCKLRSSRVYESVSAPTVRRPEKLPNYPACCWHAGKGRPTGEPAHRERGRKRQKGNEALTEDERSWAKRSPVSQ